MHYDFWPAATPAGQLT